MDTSTQRHEEITQGRDPFRRVVAACCLGAAGRSAAARAAQLPLAPRARLTILHVLRPLLRRSQRVPLPEVRRELEDLAAVAVGAAREAGNDRPEVVPSISYGWPAVEIVRAAWQERADVIVVGPPAVRLDGSRRATVFRVMRSGELPIVVARREAPTGYRRVLCAVDRSITAFDTIAFAARLARPGAARLTLFHGVHVPFEPWLHAGAPEDADETTGVVRGMARLTRDELGAVPVLIRPGDFAGGVARAAIAVHADVVVVGTHGRSGLARVIHGSEAEWAVAHLPFDVAVSRVHRLTLERR